MKRLCMILLILCRTTIISCAQTGASREATADKKNGNVQIPAAGLYSVSELERQRKAALAEVELISKLLNETNTNAKNSLNRLNLLSQQLLARKKIVTLLEQEIAALDTKIKTMSDDIDLLNRDLAGTKDNYARSMQNRQQEHRTTQYKMLLILSAENLSQSYRRMRYLREYADWQKEEAGRIVKKQDEIVRRKAELEESRKEKTSLLTQREQENKKLEEEEKLRQKEVRDLNSKQKDLQKQLQEKKKQADALNKQIENLIAEDIMDSERNVPSRVSDTVSGLSASKQAATNYVMTESEVLLSSDFAANRGKLPFPLTGNYAIVSDFGRHQHRNLSNVKTNNNGIDIQTTTGAEARAIFKGVVTRVFVMPGYNHNVIVRHGDYLTVYSNLSQVYVKAGDVVATRQAVGKIFTDTEKGNETILHFQIWKERTKLNPAAWIK